MKSIDDKVEMYVEKLCFCDDLRQGICIEMARSIILRALTEQDKDTRHACAEAVASLETVSVMANYVDVDKAHAACMNTREV